MNIFRIATSIAALAFLASCEEVPVNPPSNAAAVAPTPIPGYWNGDGVSGSPKIIVSISEQRAYFYKGKTLVGESTVSTGKPGFGTPPGSYTVLSKDPTHVSTVFGDYVDDFGNVLKSNIDVRKDSKPPGGHYDGARMPFAMFFRGGYAMHQGYVPPYAASHGCIRLPQGMAETFFNAAEVGTPVIVKQEAVTHRETVPRPGPAPMTASVPPSNEYVRSPAVSTVQPIPVRYSAPPTVRSYAPVPVPSPTPVARRSTTQAVVPTRTVAPGPVRSNVTAPVISPTPAPTRSQKRRQLRSRHHRQSSAPSPTPSRAQ